MALSSPLIRAANPAVLLSPVAPARIEFPAEGEAGADDLASGHVPERTAFEQKGHQDAGPGLVGQGCQEVQRCACVEPTIRALDMLSKNSYCKSMKTIVSEKGQITIPKAVRDKLGIVAGTVLEVDSVEGKLVAVKKEPVDAILKWRGKGKISGNRSVDEYLNGIRG